MVILGPTIAARLEHHDSRTLNLAAPNSKTKPQIMTASRGTTDIAHHMKSESVVVCCNHVQFRPP